MNAGRRFVLDANVLMQARRSYYAFDICPGFWNALLQQHRSERVSSIDKIKNEIDAGRDDLKDWANETAPSSFFKGTADKKVSDAFRDMVNWVQGEELFLPEAKAKFAAVADGWLVAFAKVNGAILVTGEVYAPECKTEVKIPNVCVEFGVKYVDTYEMLRDLKEQFVLKTRKRKK